MAQSVTVDGLDGPFLPTVDRPARIGPPVSAVDVDNGFLLTDALARRGLTYSVSSLHILACGETCDGVDAAGTDRALAVPRNWPMRCGRSPTTARATDPSRTSPTVGRRLADGRRNIAGIPSTGTSIGALSALLRAGGEGPR